MPPSPGPTLSLAQHPEADALLNANPLALLIAMLLDQQIPMERAFLGPYVLAERLGGRLEAADIADRDAEEFTELAARPPAIHRFPASMATRIQALCRHLVESYGGRAEAVWEDAADGAELQRRLVALPGFGAQKAKIFAALLGKQVGVRPPGWAKAAAPYTAEGQFQSVADVVDAESIERVRAHKSAQKRAAKGR
ncbi:MAG: HhH-GPD-type base excision DNA repair protein [Frankiaceae bacterium]